MTVFGTEPQAQPNSSAILLLVLDFNHFQVLYEHRFKPEYMELFISFQILDEDPALSRWTLSTYQFNRTWEFSWVARNLAPIPYQKVMYIAIHCSAVAHIDAVIVVCFYIHCFYIQYQSCASWVADPFYDKPRAQELYRWIGGWWVWPWIVFECPSVNQDNKTCIGFWKCQTLWKSVHRLPIWKLTLRVDCRSVKHADIWMHRTM